MCPPNFPVSHTHLFQWFPWLPLVSLKLIQVILQPKSESFLVCLKYCLSLSQFNRVTWAVSNCSSNCCSFPQEYYILRCSQQTSRVLILLSWWLTAAANMADIKLNCCTSEAAQSLECSHGDELRSWGGMPGVERHPPTPECSGSHIPAHLPTGCAKGLAFYPIFCAKKPKGTRQRGKSILHPFCGAARSVPGPAPHQTTPWCSQHQLEDKVLCKSTCQQVGITLVESSSPTVSPKGSKGMKTMNENHGGSRWKN